MSSKRQDRGQRPGEGRQPDTTPDAARETRVIKTLWPPRPGTIKQQRSFGKRLLCVRYRHDAAGLRRYTTVEIIVDEAPVNSRKADSRLYMVQIDQRDASLRERAKKHGARWSNNLKRWLMNGATVKRLNLEPRAQPVPRHLLAVEHDIPITGHHVHN